MDRKDLALGIGGGLLLWTFGTALTVGVLREIAYQIDRRMVDDLQKAREDRAANG